jgi:hypothetical protein
VGHPLEEEEAMTVLLVCALVIQVCQLVVLGIIANNQVVIYKADH